MNGEVLEETKSLEGSQIVIGPATKKPENLHLVDMLGWVAAL